jgi:hypothetical protein
VAEGELFHWEKNDGGKRGKKKRAGKSDSHGRITPASGLPASGFPFFALYPSPRSSPLPSPASSFFPFPFILSLYSFLFLFLSPPFFFRPSSFPLLSFPFFPFRFLAILNGWFVFKIQRIRDFSLVWFDVGSDCVELA